MLICWPAAAAFASQLLARRRRFADAAAQPAIASTLLLPPFSPLPFYDAAFR
jgi:hypothetical protein